MASESKSSNAIGIDLGTTYSCVGVWKLEENRVEIVHNDQGNRTTPSYVSFRDSERLIGEEAKNQIGWNLYNTVFDAKRLIGRKYDDAEVQSDIKHFPFNVINKSGKPYIMVKYLGEEKQFSPEEISSMVLLKMKQMAESHLHKTIKDAVITVPAYFNDSQRQATKDAGVIAGFNVLRILNEPTAAAIAYGLHLKTTGRRNVLVFDLGGGTFDVSLLTIDGGIFEVRATAGDTHLGGEDFNNRLVDNFIKEFKCKHRKDLSLNTKSVLSLRQACERAKRTLSSATQTSIDIDSLFDSIDFRASLTRPHFEHICRDLFQRTLVPVEQVLRDSKIGKDDVHDVILVGGSTRIPAIVQLVSDFFGGKECNKGIHPDEVVAEGAAIHASILAGDNSESTQGLLLLDVAPLSLGIETEGGIMSVLVERNTTIPTEKTKTYSTTRDFQRSVLIKVYEGERSLTRDNHLLGTFELSGIQPQLRGAPNIEVTFVVDPDGILNVSAHDNETGRSNHITINKDSGRLSPREIESMIRDAKMYQAEDQANADRINARNSLESYIYHIRDVSNDEKVKNRMTLANRVIVENALNVTTNWLEATKNASKDEYERKKEDLRRQAGFVSILR